MSEVMMLGGSALVLLGLGAALFGEPALLWGPMAVGLVLFLLAVR